MTRTTISHDLTSSQLKRLVSSSVTSQARAHGLSSRWQSSTTWVGEGSGVTIHALLQDQQVVLEVDKAWYIPVSEGRIAGAIRRELEKLLASHAGRP